MNQLEVGGSQEIRPPVALERPGRPALDAGTSGFEACNASLGPQGSEPPFFGYKGVQRGFGESWSVRRSR